MMNRRKKLCTVFTAGLIMAAAAVSGCGKSEDIKDQTQEEKKEPAEKTEEVNVKELGKINRMDVVFNEKKTVKIEKTFYGTDGISVLPELSGTLYCDTYDGQEVNLWTDQNGESRMFLHGYEYGRDSDGGLGIKIYPLEKQRKENEDGLLMSENQNELFQISKKGKEEVTAAEYNEKGEIKVSTVIDLAKSDKETQESMGADSGEAEKEYIFDPDTKFLISAEIYYTPIDGKRLITSRFLYTYGEKSDIPEFMEPFEHKKMRKITCIAYPDTKSEEEYEASVPAGIDVMIAVSEDEKLYDDKEGEKIHKRAGNEADTEVYLKEE